MPTFTRSLSTNNYGPAKFIVDGTTIANGTHSTISAALTSAVSGDVIFLRPGTYTEDLTLKAGVTITTFRGSGKTANVIVTGNATFTGTGIATLSNFRIQTNGASCLTISGASASIVNLLNMDIQVTNGTGITFSSSNAGAQVNLINCSGDIAGSFALLAQTSAGTFDERYSEITNSAGSTVASTASAGFYNCRWSRKSTPITTSATCVSILTYCIFDCSATNATAATFGGTTTTSSYNRFLGGTASAVSIGGTMNSRHDTISSSNTNAITGAGTLNYSGMIFTGTSKLINGTVTAVKVSMQPFAEALAAADGNKVGTCNFNSAQFSVDANGFVSTSGTGILNTLTPNSGTTPVVPTGGTISVLGTGSTTTVGSLNTLTVELTGLTANSVLYGLGTATIGLVASGTTGQVLQTNTGAAPTYSTATYPSSTTINQILYSSATNVVGGLTTANQGVLTTGTTGIPVITPIATNGQLIIGSTAGAPAAATLTAGANITITNASNSITIAASAGSSFTWQTISANQTLVKNNGYICISPGGALALALPSTVSSTIGDVIEVTLDGATSWSITQAASQQIRYGNAQTVVTTGALTSTMVGDTVRIVYQGSGRWNVLSSIGNITVS